MEVDATTAAALLTEVTAASVPLLLMGELAGEIGLVALAQRVRSAGAGLELDGFLQQARDAFHLEFD